MESASTYSGPVTLRIWAQHSRMVRVGVNLTTASAVDGPRWSGRLDGLCDDELADLAGLDVSLLFPDGSLGAATVVDDVGRLVGLGVAPWVPFT